MSEKQNINIGIIGTGFARTTQLPALRACVGARIVMIASGHLENAERAAREFGIEHFTADWRETIRRDDIDLISIVTPPVTHLEMALAALDAGKAVLCEKPMAMNASETRRMCERAGETGLLALIDHELRFLPGRRQMRAMLLRGEIGTVHHAKLLYRSDSRLDATRAWNWWSDRKAGGGALGAIGSHAVDGFRWLLGAEVEQVFATLATRVAERPDPEGRLRPVTTDDEAHLILRFAGNELTRDATGTVTLSVVEAGPAEHRLEIFGSQGALMLAGDELWRARAGAGEWQRVEVESIAPAEGMRDSEWSRGFTILSRQIVRALREGRRTIEEAATFDDGHRTQLVLDAALRSHHSGCWETVENL